jgi:hypothetical protein
MSSRLPLCASLPSAPPCSSGSRGTQSASSEEEKILTGIFSNEVRSLFINLVGYDESNIQAQIYLKVPN